jgi:ribosomal protein S18 acetylase RimI-like enzyme
MASSVDTNTMTNNEKPALTVRRLARRDIEEVARLHLEQFSASRSSRLGKPFVRKMYQWFLHHQPNLALVATIHDKPVGFAMGAIGGYGRRISRYALPEILWGMATHPRLLLNKSTFLGFTSYVQAFRPGFARQSAKPVTTTAETATLTKASLASIAVSGKAQGQGVGKALLKAFERAATEQGASILGLSVETDNVAARRLYESCGWEASADPGDAHSTYYGKKVE